MMQVGSVVTMTGQVTFGRDEAMFEGLLGFVAQLSVMLWALVILTLVIRFIGIFLYRRGAARKALVSAGVPSATIPAATTISTFDEILQPAGTSTATVVSIDPPVNMPHRVPAYAASSTEV